MDPNSIVWLVYRALKVNPVRPYRFRKDMDMWARITADHVYRFLRDHNVEMKHGKPDTGHGRYLGVAEPSSNEPEKRPVDPEQSSKD